MKDGFSTLSITSFTADHKAKVQEEKLFNKKAVSYL